MPERSSKRRGHLDINQLAAAIVSEATSEAPKAEEPEKNPHAVALGRIGGLKGGAVRAAKLSPDQRREIARKAAAKRWGTP